MLEDFFEYTINVELPEIIERIQGWLEVYKKQEIPMLITTYEEFFDNEALFFQRILDFYQIPEHNFHMKPVSKDQAHNFRKGLKDEWREVLSLEQQERINHMIPEELFDFFNWER